MNVKTKYVLGFLFDDTKKLVALIEKQKPSWQKDHLNGIGGKVENTDVDAKCAMVREFQEETGALTGADKWRHFATMEGNDWSVDCFTQSDSGALSNVTTCTNEKVFILHLPVIANYKTISNVPWLISMALDKNMGNPPFFANISYVDNR